jgi:hypothetical protein
VRGPWIRLTADVVSALQTNARRVSQFRPKRLRVGVYTERGQRRDRIRVSQVKLSEPSDVHDRHLECPVRPEGRGSAGVKCSSADSAQIDICQLRALIRN